MSVSTDGLRTVFLVVQAKRAAVGSGFGGLGLNCEDNGSDFQSDGSRLPICHVELLFSLARKPFPQSFSD